jgi:hypothetical protein
MIQRMIDTVSNLLRCSLRTAQHETVVLRFVESIGLDKLQTRPQEEEEVAT